VKIYDSYGNIIVDVFFNKQLAGINTFIWQTSEIASGYYYFQIIIDGKIAGGRSAIKK